MIQATPKGLGTTYRLVQNRPACEISSSLSEIEFAFTGSWTAFASTCCCRDHGYDPDIVSSLAANVSTSPLGKLELWTCPDLSPSNASSVGGSAHMGRPLLHKLRTREVRDPETGAVVESGLHLRPFCSPAFAPGVSLPFYDEDSLAFVVRINGSIQQTNLW